MLKMRHPKLDAERVIDVPDGSAEVLKKSGWEVVPDDTADTTATATRRTRAES